MIKYLLIILFPCSVFASFGAVNQFRNLYSTSPISTTAWKKVGTTTDVVSTVEVFDSSGQTLQFAVGPVGSELVQFIITPGGNGQISLTIPNKTAISVRALSSDATVGELDINLFN